ncbi:MAG: phosphoketolase family protein [Aeriscardovia sp.]|nr:phosphoketolase family protein [Aeriscardovia sp.]
MDSLLGTPWVKDGSGSGSFEDVDRYFRAANYMSVGQIYLKSNPLMREPFTQDDVKQRLVGHWGTTPGLNFLFGHVNRLIKDHKQNTVFIMGPGHGGPAGRVQSFIDGSYRHVHPEMPAGEAGLERFFRQFSWPGGDPSHFGPEIPGSMHEGGELGYSLSHAYGAALDNPSLLTVCVVGDGEAETGALATSWWANKFMNPKTDGMVLPILHLNGYKIANPSILSRISPEDRADFFRGMGYDPHEFVAGYDGEDMMSIHSRFHSLLEEVFARICDIKASGSASERYPLIIFKTPKGWTGPKFVDGKKVEGTFRAHQVPLTKPKEDEGQFELLKEWLESYRPQELFDSEGNLREDVRACIPEGDLRLGFNPNTNRGDEKLDLPEIDNYEVAGVKNFGHGWGRVEATRVLGSYIRDIIRRNPGIFRLFGPDETASNRLNAVYEVTGKQWNGLYEDEQVDESMGTSGAVIEQLSEHQMEGMLEGYILTGRNGMWSSYESFAHVVDSMLNQHAKWLEQIKKIAWRKPLASLNLILSSHVWRQDHNGFTHQDPGIIDIFLNKNFNNDHVVNVYFAVDPNTLLAIAEKSFKSENKINAIVAGKQLNFCYLTMEEAKAEVAKGLGEWKWASNCQKGEEEIVLACAGDIPTQEILAASCILNAEGVKYRVVNILDLLKIQNCEENDEAISDEEFKEIFSEDKPVLFAYHSYPREIYSLIHGRPGCGNWKVMGYSERGSITTPFDMLRSNDMDRYHLAALALEMVGGEKKEGIARLEAKRQEAWEFAKANGFDIDDYANWHWGEVKESDLVGMGSSISHEHGSAAQGKADSSQK